MYVYIYINISVVCVDRRHALKHLYVCISISISIYLHTYRCLPSNTCMYVSIYINISTYIQVFEGVPTYPTASRCWDIIDKYKVNQFYTAPTLIRSLMSFGEEVLAPYSLESLRVLGSVGEPINPEAWRWYHKHVGKETCPIVDTWWQVL